MIRTLAGSSDREDPRAGSARGGFVLAAVLAAAASLLGAPPAAAAMYKWVDDQGVVHYSDKMPPEAVNKGTTVLDKQGRAVQKIEAAPTPEQRKAKEVEEEEKRAAAKIQEARARKDRALMLSYTTGAEIDGAKKRALATIDAQVQSAEAYRADLKRKQEALGKKKAGYTDKPVPGEIERDLSNIDLELARQGAIINEKKAEAVAVSAKYDADKQRWEEIKADPQRAAAAMQIDAQAGAPTKGTAAKAPAGTSASVKK